MRSIFEGFWTKDSGQDVAPVAVLNDQVPDTLSGAVFSGFNSSDYGPTFNNAGQAALMGRLQIGSGGVTESNDSGIWLGKAGALALVARSGFQAPGVPSGAIFTGFSAHPPINDAGQTAFRGGLQTGLGNATYQSSTGIWSGGVGSLRLVARGGQPVPDVTTGNVFNGRQFSFGDPLLNSNGETAFVAEMRQGVGDVTDANDWGVWSEGGGSLKLVAREGDHPPGAPTGSVFDQFFSNLVFNDAGQTAFNGGYTLENGTINFGLWSEGSGTLELVGLRGFHAPGTPDDTNFWSFREISLNGEGQLAFLGLLQTFAGGVTAANDRGLWAQNKDGNLQLIAREGDLLDVDNGPDVDMRTISELKFRGRTGNGDGYPSGFNDLGQVAFSARFTDGTSGVFVSNLVAIPEPSTAALLFAGVSLFLTRRDQL